MTESRVTHKDLVVHAEHHHDTLRRIYQDILVQNSVDPNVLKAVQCAKLIADIIRNYAQEWAPDTDKPMTAVQMADAFRAMGCRDKLNDRLWEAALAALPLTIRVNNTIDGEACINAFELAEAMLAEWKRRTEKEKS